MSAGPEPLAVLGVYTLPILMLSSITGLNQPTNIMISEDELKIGAFGRWHTYAVSDIKGKLFLNHILISGKYMSEWDLREYLADATGFQVR